ncbi:uncharacterized protein [Dysidea avara]|uniref:uncharacterized protein n=1 Tax=Dysidea avara TaxID=196820 RepID=UPI003323BA0C
MSVREEDDSERKRKVLKSQLPYLIQNLGDPSRYIPYMIANDVLDKSDKERIRAKVTSKEKAELFIDLLREREGASAFDEFVQALLEERVQSHIARRLQEALARERDNSLPQSLKKTDELISSVPSVITESYDSVNEEATPLQEDDGPLPPPPPPECLIYDREPVVAGSRSTGPLPPLLPEVDINAQIMASYSTVPGPTHAQETFDTSDECEALKNSNRQLRDQVSQLTFENDQLKQENTQLRDKLNRLTENSLMRSSMYQNGTPIPEQNTVKQSEMVPKGSSTY